MAAGGHLALSAVARHRLGLGQACPPWRGATRDSRCIASALEMRVASASASPLWLNTGGRSNPNNTALQTQDARLEDTREENST